MEGLGNKYPKLLLSKAVHKLLSSEPRERLAIQVMMTMYNIITWEKNTNSVLGKGLPRNCHSV
jgi:hypothetical protein